MATNKGSEQSAVQREQVEREIAAELGFRYDATAHHGDRIWDGEGPIYPDAEQVIEKLWNAHIAASLRLQEAETEREEYRKIRDTVIRLVAIGTGLSKDAVEESPVESIRKLKACAVSAESRLAQAGKLAEAVRGWSKTSPANHQPWQCATEGQTCAYHKTESALRTALLEWDALGSK